MTFLKEKKFPGQSKQTLNPLSWSNSLLGDRGQEKYVHELVNFGFTKT